MSAEPAIPNDPHLNTTGPADVINLNMHRRTGGQPNTRGRWGIMNAAPPPGDRRPPADDDEAALADWADSIEKSFLEIGQSLTDPTTRAAFWRTLDVWQRTLEGAHAQHIIEDRQLAKLLEILNGMRRTPGLV